MNAWGERLSGRSAWLSLLASGSTLLCCALPALLVSLGAGAALAGILSHVPQLIWLSEQKAWVFAVAALTLTVAGTLQWRARRLPCPADAQVASACARARRWSLGVYCLSLGVFLLGGYFAFVAG